MKQAPVEMRCFGGKEIKHLPYIQYSAECNRIIYRMVYNIDIILSSQKLLHIYSYSEFINETKPHSRSHRYHRSVFHTEEWQWSRAWPYSLNFWSFLLQKCKENQVSTRELSVFLMNMHVSGLQVRASIHLGNEWFRLSSYRANEVWTLHNQKLS